MIGNTPVSETLDQKRVGEICTAANRTEQGLWELYAAERKRLRDMRRYPPAVITLYANTNIGREIEIVLDESKSLFQYLRGKFKE